MHQPNEAAGYMAWDNPTEALLTVTQGETLTQGNHRPNAACRPTKPKAKPLTSTHCKYCKTPALWRMDSVGAQVTNPDKWIREGPEVGLARAQLFTDFSMETTSQPQELLGGSATSQDHTRLTMTVSSPDPDPLPTG